MNLLRPRVAPDVAPLLDDYRQAILFYLQKRNATGMITLPDTVTTPVWDAAADEMVNRLDALDAERAALGPSPSKSNRLRVPELSRE